MRISDWSSDVCSSDLEAPEAPLFVQFIRGVTVGLVAIILVASAGIDGIRMMSVLGGFPALFVITGAALSLVVLTVRGRRTALRSEGRRVGKERVSTCRSRWSP